MPKQDSHSDCNHHHHDHGHEHGDADGLTWICVVGSGLCCGLGGFASLVDLGSIHYKSVFFISGIISGGVLLLPRAWRALRRRVIEMNTLMVLAVSGAIAIGEYAEGAVVVFLFSLAELLETLSSERVRSAIEEYFRFSPTTVKVRQNAGDWVNLDPKDVQPEALVRIDSGDRIELDGIVEVGQAFVNQSNLTGESVAVEKSPGDPVYAGSVCENGYLLVKVQRPFKESRIARILKLVQEAQASKAMRQRFVDRFASVYTPAVLMLAIIVWLVPVLFFDQDNSEWFYRALVLLVIACPCALVIATPIAIVSGMTALARSGVLVKGGRVLEDLSKIKAVVFDKTGTLTKGRPDVVKVLPQSEASMKMLLSVAYSLENHVNHPLARAVVMYAQARSIELLELTDMKTSPGRGIEAKDKNHMYFLGNHAFVHDLGLCSQELELSLKILENEAYSTVVVGWQKIGSREGEILGTIAFRDELRAGAAQAINNLKEVGVSSTVLLSGDHQRAAEAIGVSAGIDRSFGDLLPEEKVTKIQEIKKEKGSLMMVGDGINDAPALAVADVGVSMPHGAEFAFEASDVGLVHDDLNLLAHAISHAKRTIRIVEFNIAFSFLSKLIFVVLGALGLAGMWHAVAVDAGSSVLVALNSMRLLKINRR